MRNVAPSRSLSQRSLNWLIAAILLALFGIFLVVVGLTFTSIEIVVPGNPSYETYVFLRNAAIVGGIVLVLVALGMAIRALTWRTDNPLAERVGDTLAQFIDEPFIFIRNINRFGLGYIDALLIGPPGLLVFRITDRKGVLFNEVGVWLEQTEKGEWAPLAWNPTNEAIDDIKKLREYLERRHLTDLPIYGVIVFTEEPPLIQVSAEKPVVQPVLLEEISYALADTYFSRDRLDPTVQREIVRILYQ